MKTYKKILLLGSGGLKIGQAGEFDYSGSQAIKALKEEGIKIILINPNIATVQTSKFMADKVYFLPVTPIFVQQVIEKEKPDGILLSFGGQTALNCGVALYKKGIFKKYAVDILGTPIDAVILTEDRHKFSTHLKKIHVKTPISKTAYSQTDALKFADEIGYPVMLRSGFALGGLGSGIAANRKELIEIVKTSFAFSPQVLIEQYLHHYKEVEYEIVRDKYDNCIAVCNMENFDPLGVHTGDSIVVAPSQTLTNFEYHYLREVSIKIVKSLGIVGECNVQFALNPSPNKNADGTRPIDYYTIEVNARLSRSSALASKATGYPLAYIAAKLALGYPMTELKNKVTEVTQACFEPALDYVVTKIPRWDMEKFKGSVHTIGTSMKSVGEVMGIGRTFEESLQKAVRMLDLDVEGVDDTSLVGKVSTNKIIGYLKNPTHKRLFHISLAMKMGMSVSKIHTLTGVDRWFLYKVQNIINNQKNIKGKELKDLTEQKLLTLKQLGFSDKSIGELVGVKGLLVRELRKKMGIIPYIFQIDTLGGEFPAKTNYLYVTYNGFHNDIIPYKKEGVVVLGSGPYRIGSSVEFDWTSVSTVMSLKNHGKKSVIINCNPETVSTDYDMSERLYFEELTFERIADIYDFEHPYGIIVSVGGQTPNNRARSLQDYGIKILGTNPKNIERAENRRAFSQLCDELSIEQPHWDTFTNIDDAVSFCNRVGFPVLSRPSFVLSGTGMKVCRNRKDLVDYLSEQAKVSREYPITISKFILDSKEVEFDAIAIKGKIKASVISEHIENAGVHSGDATIVLPPQKIYVRTERKIEEIAKKLALSLEISGPFNIQFLAKNNEVLVIEINLRASRTFPFISKVTGIDFMKLAVDAFFNKSIKEIAPIYPSFTAVKVAQFSFARLTGADPVLDVEMASTGEVACLGDSVEEAFLKGELAVGGIMPKKGIFVSLGGYENKVGFIEGIQILQNLGIPLYASEGTSIFMERYGVTSERVYKIHENKTPNALSLLHGGSIDLAINIPDTDKKNDVKDSYLIRRAVVDNNIHLLTDIKKAELFVRSLQYTKSIKIKSWDEYMSGS